MNSAHIERQVCLPAGWVPTKASYFQVLHHQLDIIMVLQIVHYNLLMSTIKKYFKPTCASILFSYGLNNILLKSFQLAYTIYSNDRNKIFVNTLEI